MSLNSFTPLNFGGLANSIDGAIDTIGKLQEQDNVFWATKNFNKFQQDTFINSLEGEKNAQPGAPGYTKGVIDQYNTQANELLLTAPNKDTASKMQMKMSEYKTQVVARAAQFEATEKSRNAAFEVTENRKYQLNWTFNNPTDIDLARKGYEEQLKASTLTPAERQVATSEFASDSRVTWFEGRSNQLQRMYANRQVSLYDTSQGIKALANEVQGYGHELSAEAMQKVSTQMGNLDESFTSKAVSGLKSKINALSADDAVSLQMTGNHVAGYAEHVNELVQAIGPDTEEAQLIKKDFESTQEAHLAGYKVTSYLGNLDIASAQGVITDLENKISQGGQGVAEYAKQLVTAQQAVKSFATEALKDPASIAAGNSSVKHATTLQDRVLNSIAMQEDAFGKGVARITQNGQRDEIVNNIVQNKDNKDAVQQTLNAIKQNYNFKLPDGSYAYEKVMQEVIDKTKDDAIGPEFSILLAHGKEPHYNNFYDAVLLGRKEIGIKAQNYHNKTDEQMTTTMNDIEDTMRGKLKGAVRGLQDIENSDKINDLSKAGGILAQYYYSRGLSEGDATKKAFEDIFAKHYNTLTEGKSALIIPKTVGDTSIDPSNVKEHIKQSQTSYITNNLLNKGYKVDVGGVDSRYSPQFAQERLKDTLTNKTYWKTDTDGNGVILYGDFGPDGQVPIPMLNPDGKRVFIRQSFSKMMQQPMGAYAFNLGLGKAIQTADKVTKDAIRFGFDLNLFEISRKSRQAEVDKKKSDERYVKDYRFQDGSKEYRPVFVNGEQVN